MSGTAGFLHSELEIAIIGMAGRFPGARTTEEYWRNLREGIESISFFTDRELEDAGVSPETLRDPNYIKARGVLQDIDLFDASFFNYSPREAEIIDPQHRLFLECAWESLENAGYDSETSKGLIGVYAGMEMSAYMINLHSNPDLFDSVGKFQISIGNEKDYLATRVSYKLNLMGPSLTVQTACSTSMVAVHLACQGLLSGECDMALAGGVTAGITQKAGYYYQEGGIASPDGHCRAFDARAKGTIGGSGLGIVVLKRLADALADGDNIHAIIKGTAINNDGALKVGFTAPRIEGQAAVIRAAQAAAGVEPQTITYIEAHGTGTELGDPIEIAALTKVFHAKTDKKHFCAIGSVKTNIGHLDAAAGIAGLIKTVLALKHKQMPPSLHFTDPNPKIDFANSPFYVNARLSKWNANGYPRRAGVSSFGIGGTNAHAILEEAPAREPSGPSRPWKLIALSAKTDSALEAATSNLGEHFQQNPDTNLADAAFTLQVGRRAFNHRRVLLCRDLDEAITLCQTRDPARVATAALRAEDRPLAFMFSGQGSQYVDMGLGLYNSELIFRDQVDKCSELLKPRLQFDLRDALYPGERESEESGNRLNQTFITQPALFVIEYALARMWMAWGIHPQVMIGHSIGEYVAACLAGVFSLEEALALVATRGRLMQQLPGGAMITVSLPEQDVLPLLEEGLSLAAVNGKSLCVVSGAADLVNELKDRLTEQGHTCRLLRTSHAFHSEMMSPIMKPFLEEVKKIRLNPVNIPFISNLTGTWITNEEATDPAYWARHLRQPVRFAEGLRELVESQQADLLEVGPGLTLSGLANRYMESRTDQVVLSSLRHPNDRTPDEAFLLKTLGRLWVTGKRVDWKNFYIHERRHRIPLGTYPFERKRFWVERKETKTGLSASQEMISRKPDLADWFYIPSWKQSSALPPRSRSSLSDQQLCWLVFLDTCGLGSQITTRLQEAGQTVVTVREAKSFARLNDCAFTLNPQRVDDYRSLLNELSRSDRVPDAIIHLWSVSRNNTAQSAAEAFESSQYLGYYSLLFLGQAICEQIINRSVRIHVITNDVQDVTGQEELRPEKATIIGPCIVIPQEYPNIICRCIDIAIPEPATRRERDLVDRLVTEVTGDVSELLTAYRGNHRWEQVFDKVRPPVDGAIQPGIRESGVYLIVGGLGYIGLTLAEYLARTFKAKLILVGRTPFPVKDRWEDYLNTNDAEDEISRKIQRMLKFEEFGAEVMVLDADLANQHQMQGVINRIHEKFGALHGVIHAAGAAGENSVCSIQGTGQKEFESQARSKVKGLMVLENVLRDQELDFCLLSSSIASVLGGLGFAAYCAANRFMDAFAHKRAQSCSTPWISLNWDSWRLDVEKESTAGRGTTLADLGVAPQEGIEVLRRILSLDHTSQVVISTGDLQSRIDQWVKLNNIREQDWQDNSNQLSLYPRPNLQNDFIAPRNGIEELLAKIWQELLGIEPISVHDNFFELGGHSLLAIQVISKIRDRFQTNVGVEALFVGPTIAEISREIVKAQIGDVGSQDISDLLAEIEQLSEHEVGSALLNEAITASIN
jgi:acyl transferase domain-containing protein